MMPTPPKSSEVAEAREIIAALQAANDGGLGTVVVKDKLVEHHHVKAAERLLKLHDMIAALEEEHV
jgi:citrate lyase subunit beta / citryl-CoA lyase